MKKFLYKLWTSKVSFVLAWIVIIFGTVWFTLDMKQSIASREAYYDGYNEALDTVCFMMREQAGADTTHCTMIMVDTTKYYLQHKCK